MPFTNYSGFDAKTLRSMSAAYDAAIARLGIGQGNPLTSMLAAKIAEIASGGEFSPEALCEQAIAALRRAQPDLP